MVYNIISSKNFFKGKNVLVQGLGLNNGGVGVVKFLAGTGAIIRITDLRDEDTLKPSLNKLAEIIKEYNIKLILGQHREKDFEWADIVIRNPAVPPNNKFINIAKKHGARVYMDISLFISLVNNPIVGITGTKGKSTTTLLTFNIIENYLASRKLSDLDKSTKNQSSQTSKVYLAGNIGKPPIEYLDILKPKDWVVLELSSFQLSVMGENKQSPHIAIVTNIFTDHINWHKSFDHYLWSKLQITAHQTANDFLVINLESNELDKFINHTKAQVIGITLNPKLIKKYKNSLYAYLYIKDSAIYVNSRGKNKEFALKDKVLIKLKDLKTQLKGIHNMYNILLAIGATNLTDLSIGLDRIKLTLQKFQGAYGRQQFVRTFNNIDFYNDTAATVDVAIKAAIQRFYEQYKDNVILIMGGVDKGIDYLPVIKYAQGKLKAIVLLEGSASDKIEKLAQKFNIPVYGKFNKLKEAVLKAIELTKKYQKAKCNNQFAVSLTPGATSFNMFLNEWDRGHKYDAIINSLES